MRSSLPLLPLALTVACAPPPRMRTQEDVLDEFYAAPLPERKPVPAAPPPADPPRERPKGSPISHEAAKAEPSPEVAESSMANVDWVRENCTPQSYPVSECEVRCRSSAARDTNCEADCESYQAFASCPMVECPVGTDPHWITEYYRAECQGRQAKLVDPDAAPQPEPKTPPDVERRVAFAEAYERMLLDGKIEVYDVRAVGADSAILHMELPVGLCTRQFVYQMDKKNGANLRKLGFVQVSCESATHEFWQDL